MWFLELRWWLGCAFALFVGGWGANIELRGRAQADTFCEWVRIGATAGEVSAAAERLEEEPILIVRSDSIAVGFGGVLPRSYHVCSIATEREKVSGKSRQLRQHAVLSAPASPAEPGGVSARVRGEGPIK